MEPSNPAFDKEITFNYVLRGENGTITLTLSKELNEYFGCLSNQPFSSRDEQFHEYVENPVQDKYLEPLVAQIQAKTENRDDQVRIAVSLVQQIPYDTEEAEETIAANYTLSSRYPYQVLYHHGGICGGKSFLLGYLLKKMGYGVAFFEIPSIHHQAVGISCNQPYDFRSLGYGYIEATNPAIMTQEKYEIAGEAVEIPDDITVYPIANGSKFESINEEYADAREMEDAIEKVNVPPSQPKFHIFWTLVGPMSFYNPLYDSSYDWKAGRITYLYDKYGIRPYEGQFSSDGTIIPLSCVFTEKRLKVNFNYEQKSLKAPSVVRFLDKSVFEYFCDGTLHKSTGWVYSNYNRDYGNNRKFYWDFGDGTTSDEASPYHLYQTAGIYTVSFTVETEGKTPQEIDIRQKDTITKQNLITVT